MTNTLTRRHAVELLAIGAHLPCASGEDRKELYALTASPQPFGDLVFPGVLFSLGLVAPEAQWASGLVTPAQGIDYVLYSFEQQVAVLAGPKNAANEIVFLSFDSPGKPRAVKVDLQGMSVVGRHFVFIGGISTSLSDFPVMPSTVSLLCGSMTCRFERLLRWNSTRSSPSTGLLAA